MTAVPGLRRRALVLGAGALAAPPLWAALPAEASCVVPAKAGGGFDVTCKLAQAMLAPQRPGLKLDYMPGGIGAVAFDRIVRSRSADAGQLVAFSSGSLLNLVQGKFGPHKPADVRWLATLGTDYGVIAVRKGSRLQALPDLMAELAKNAAGVVFGAGGTVGSQDWFKAALLVKAAGRDFKAMRFVSFEGGGDALGALLGGHVDVYSGDATELRPHLAGGNPALRVIAVLADARLPRAMAGIATAREQGVDLAWPTVRGLYLGPGVADEHYRAWVAEFERALAAPGFAALRDAHGMYPLSLTGAAVDGFVRDSVARYRALAASLGQRVAPA